MAKALFSNKNYNLMDSLSTPIQGFILWPLNTINFAVGMIQGQDLNVLSAIIGIMLNLMWHFYKFFRQIKIDAKADQKHDLETALPFERNCANCQKPFQPKNEGQVFCSPPSTCFEEKLEKLRIKEIKGAEDITL